MKVFTIGQGFVASHFSYPSIPERLQPDAQQIRKVLEQYKPGVLVNCIGFCGTPTIDQCEVEQEKTMITNTVIPILLAAECEKLGIHFVHVGSGCIFSGESPNLTYTQSNGQPLPDMSSGYFTMTTPAIKIDRGFCEADIANPQSFYSRSKYAADLVLGEMKNTAILRIRMPISNKNHPRNLINKLRGYKKIINLPNSMTFMSDFERCLDWVIEENYTGIFHVVNPQPLTAVRIMQEYQKYIPEHTFDILHTEAELDQLTVAKRSNCMLQAFELKCEGFQMTNSEEALTTCMREYIANLKG